MANNNKVIIKHCPNFYKIINYDYNESDTLALKLVEIYKSYIFSIDVNNYEDLRKIEKLDLIISKYLEDYYFRKDMNQKLLEIKVNKNSNNIIKTIVESILNAFETYEMGYTRNIYFARWF